MAVVPYWCCCGGGGGGDDCRCGFGASQSFSDCRQAVGYLGMNWAPQEFKSLGPKAVGTQCSGDDNDIYEYRSSIELGPFSFSQTMPRQWSYNETSLWDDRFSQRLTVSFPAMRLYAATVPDAAGWSPGTDRWLRRIFDGSFRPQNDKFNQIGSYLYALPADPACTNIQVSFQADGYNGEYLNCSGRMTPGGGTFLEGEQTYRPGWPVAVFGYRTLANGEFELRKVLPVVRLCGRMVSSLDGGGVLLDIILHRGLNWSGHTSEPYLDENSAGELTTFSGVTWMVQREAANSIVATNYYKINYPTFHNPRMYELAGEGSWDWAMTILDPCPPPARPTNDSLVLAHEIRNPLRRCRGCGG